MQRLRIKVWSKETIYDVFFRGSSSKIKTFPKIPDVDNKATEEQVLDIPRWLKHRQLLANLEVAENQVARMVASAPDLLRDLADLIQHRERVWSKRQTVIAGSYGWSRTRTITIRQLGKLRKKLDDVCVTANCVKASANAGAIVGGLGMVSRALFPDVSDGATSFFEAMKTAGDVAVPVATLFENVISHIYISEAKSAFRDDATHSRPIVELLGYSRELDRRYEEIFHCSFRKSQSHEITERIDNKAGGIGHLIESIEIGLQIKRVFNEKKGQLLRNVLGLVERIKKELDNPRKVRVLKSVLQVVFAMLGAGYVERDASDLALLSLKYLVQTATDETVIQCLSEVSNIAMHAFSLNRALKIAKEGKSEYSAAISDLKDQLKTELDMLSLHFKKYQ